MDNKENASKPLKSGEEMRVFLQRLMGCGLERPQMYGGSPQGADGVFHYWRYIWAELTDRNTEFFNAMELCYGDTVREELLSPEYWQQSCDPQAYRIVVEFWRSVDWHLAIEYPPDIESKDSLPQS